MGNMPPPMGMGPMGMDMGQMPPQMMMGQNPYMMQQDPNMMGQMGMPGMFPGQNQNDQNNQFPNQMMPMMPMMPMSMMNPMGMGMPVPPHSFQELEPNGRVSKKELQMQIGDMSPETQNMVKTAIDHLNSIPTVPQGRDTLVKLQNEKKILFKIIDKTENAELENDQMPK